MLEMCIVGVCDDDDDFIRYGSQSAGLVTNKVQCKLQKYKNVQLQSQLYPRHNGPNNKI